MNENTPLGPASTPPLTNVGHNLLFFIEDD